MQHAIPEWYLRRLVYAYGMLIFFSRLNVLGVVQQIQPCINLMRQSNYANYVGKYNVSTTSGRILLLDVYHVTTQFQSKDKLKCN